MLALAEWKAGMGRLALVAMAASLLGACAGGAKTPPAAAQTLQPSAQAPAETKLAALHVPTLEELMGAPPAKVVSLLGEPALRRQEPQVQMWQYPSFQCVLYVVLYEEAGGYHVTNVMTHGGARVPDNPTPQEVSACMEAAMREAREGA